jgi:DNA-binding CsgD family transcriptional regulator
MYVAVIGDIVRSRHIIGRDRSALQRRIESALDEMNRNFAHALAAKLLITVGDEFQGLFHDPTVLPQVIRRLETSVSGVDVRLGIGRGPIHTDLREYAIGMDGPAWFEARRAIQEAKKGRRLGGVFAGFGQRDDLTLNGLARALHHARTRLTARQRTLLEALLENETQTQVADRVGVTRQAVNKQARAAGWEAYQEAESAWRWVLANPSQVARR